MHKSSVRTASAAVLLMVTLLSSGCGGSEARKVSFVERGEKYLAEKNYDKASVEFRNALQIDPKFARAHYLYGKVEEQKNNYQQALGQYQAAVDLDPNLAVAQAAVARIYLLGGVADKALELAEAGLKKNPQDAEMLTIRAAVQARKGNVVAALEDGEAAYKLAPKDPNVIALLAGLYKQSARTDKAAEVVNAGVKQLPENIELRQVLADLEYVQGHFTEAEAQLRKVIEIEPKNMSYRNNLARFFLLQKNVDAAEKVLAEAVASDPKNVAPRESMVEMLSVQRSPEVAAARAQEYIKSDPDNTALKLVVAGFYQKAKQTDKAEALYREVIKQADLQAAGLTARNRLAAMFIDRKDVKQAESLANEVLKESPRDADALIIRGNLALARGDAPAAITDLRAVLRDQPNSVSVMRALARAHQQNNEAALAEETLRTAVQANPTDQGARFDLSQLLVQAGKADQALPIVQQLAKEFPNSNAMEMLFRAQASTHDLVAARATAEELQKLRPKNAIGFYFSALVDEAEKKFDAARKNYERALELQPDVSEPLTALVKMDVADKRFDQAMARLNQMIARNPDNAVAYNLKAELLMGTNKFAEALSVYQALIAKAPKWWIPYRGKAAAHWELKQPDQAVETLRTGYATTQSPDLALNLATFFDSQKKPDEAIKVYEEWLTREPRSQVAANNLAMLLVTHRTDAESLKRANTLVEQFASSNDANMLDTAGWVKLKSGAAKDAVTLLQKAADKAPNAAVVRYHLGLAQLKNGDKAGARTSLEKALANNASFDGVEDARTTLQGLK